MKYLYIIAKKYKFLIAVYIVMGLVQSFLQSFSSGYFQRVIDNFTNNNLSISNIVIYGVVMISLYIISYLDEYPWRKLEHGIVLKLKINALQKISVIDYLEYVKIGTGTLIQQIENGASAGGGILFNFYLRLISELLPAMIFSFIFIFTINRVVAVTILSGYIVVFMITNLLLKILYKFKANILVNEEKFNHFLIRGFMEMVVFRVNRRFPGEIKKTETAAGEIISNKVKMSLIHEAFFAVFAILVGFIKIGIIAYGWSTKNLTIGAIVALIALVENAYTPIAIFNVLYVQYKLDKVAFERYTNFLDAKEDSRLKQGIELSDIAGNISFSQIGFNYNERVILQDFNLRIEKGKTVAFVGESGSGKSTVVKLLAGLLKPDSGCITIDNIRLDGMNLNSFYQYIAYLPQEPPVFNGTLRENLIFDEEIDESLLLKALKQTGLWTLYGQLENGLDTPLGEKGVSLSGGERQQLALARLWFTDANIIIFDEATSAIDNLTENTVMENVMTLLNGKTIIAIAHRLDSVKSFNQIILFQNGHIAEQGNFEELMKRNSHFYELYSRNRQ